MPKAAPMDISLPVAAPKEVLADTSISLSPAPVINKITLDAQMTDVQKARIDEVLLEYQHQEQQALKTLHAMHQCNHTAEVVLQLECAKLHEAELQAQLSQTKLAALSQEHTPMTVPGWVSSSYVPPSQRPGSEAAEAARQSSSYAPSLLSSVPSELLPLPSRPNAPSVVDSIHMPTPGPSMMIDKGKQRATSEQDADDFIFPVGRHRYQSFRNSLLDLQGPVRDFLSITSMEKKPTRRCHLTCTFAGYR